MNRNQEAIIDLIRACNLIIEFCKNLDKEAFIKDKTCLDHFSCIKLKLFPISI
jgi:uncharacterized protein with HEPN domain